MWYSPSVIQASLLPGEKDRMRGSELRLWKDLATGNPYVSGYARRWGFMQKLVPASEIDSRLRGNDAARRNAGNIRVSG